MSDEYDSLQSQSDAMKTDSQSLLAAAAAAAAIAAESLEPTNPSDAVDMGDRKPAKSADDDKVLNLVKVKESEELVEMEAGSIAKEDEGDEKSDVTASAELVKCESGNVKKEADGKDDEDTLSESETAAASDVKPTATAADSADRVKDEAAANLTRKDDADDDVYHSAVPSACPEVC